MRVASKMENYVTYSEKGKPAIVVGGYKYCFHKLLRNHVQRWTCPKKQCLAYMKVDQNNAVMECKNEHNHEKEDEATLSRKSISNELKVKAVAAGVFESPAELVRTELGGRVEGTKLSRNDLVLIRKNIYRARSLKRSRAFKSAQEGESFSNWNEIVVAENDISRKEDPEINEDCGSTGHVLEQDLDQPGPSLAMSKENNISAETLSFLDMMSVRDQTDISMRYPEIDKTSPVDFQQSENRWQHTMPNTTGNKQTKRNRSATIPVTLQPTSEYEPATILPIPPPYVAPFSGELPDVKPLILEETTEPAPPILEGATQQMEEQKPEDTPPTNIHTFSVTDNIRNVEHILAHLRIEKILLEIDKLKLERQKLEAEKRNIRLRHHLLSLHKQIIFQDSEDSDSSNITSEKCKESQGIRWPHYLGGNSIVPAVINSISTDHHSFTGSQSEKCSTSHKLQMGNNLNIQKSTESVISLSTYCKQEESCDSKDMQQETERKKRNPFITKRTMELCPRKKCSSESNIFQQKVFRDEKSVSSDVALGEKQSMVPQTPNELQFHSDSSVDYDVGSQFRRQTELSSANLHSHRQKQFVSEKYSDSSEVSFSGLNRTEVSEYKMENSEINLDEILELDLREEPLIPRTRQTSVSENFIINSSDVGTNVKSHKRLLENPSAEGETDPLDSKRVKS